MIHPVAGERDLARLLAGLHPVLDPVPYAFCLLPPGQEAVSLTPLALFRESEGLTLVVPRETAEAAGLTVQFEARRITLTVHSDLEAVGMMAAVAQALAARQVPCNVIAAIHHDHLFVPEAKVGPALAAIRSLQAEHQGAVRVEWLADHPECLDTLAAWHHAEWRELLPGWTAAQARADLETHRGRATIPTTVVACAGDQVIGSASLLERDIPGTEAWSPWLASVYVDPAYRRRGIGWRLVDRVLDEARGLGITVLYLFTTGAEAWYAARGWVVVDRVPHAGQDAAIMAYDLSAQRGTFGA